MKSITTLVAAISPAIVGLVALTTLPSPAFAQALTSMRSEVKSFTHQFAVRVSPMNPHQHRIKAEIRVYDETFRPVDARVVPSEKLLAAQGSRGVMVVVPFAGANERRIRICAESVPFSSKTSAVRTQVCGRYLARRFQ